MGGAHPTCAAASTAAGEPLAGTAITARRWLVVEWKRAWGRDGVLDSGLPDAALAAVAAFDGRTVLARGRARTRGTSLTVFVAESTERGGSLGRIVLSGIDALATAELAQAEPVEAPLLLVCGHGKRDACCARLGPAFVTALAAHVPSGQLWQASHLGGHRFAPNLVVLPWGVQLGRIPPDRAGEVGALVAAGRIPLDAYRGRTLYEAPVQAAEIEVRRRFGFDRVGDLRLLQHETGTVRFGVPGGEATVRVTRVEGPRVPVSCGEESGPSAAWRVEFE